LMASLSSRTTLLKTHLCAVTRNGPISLQSDEGLGHADAYEARFRSAAEMVTLWRRLDLPAWVAPYTLWDTRIGYEEALLYGELPEVRVQEAAKACWGDGWRRKLQAAHQRQKLEDIENR